MILVDGNVLLYAYVTGFDQHAAAREWLERELATAPRVGLPWSSLLAFVRMVTNPRVFSEPARIADAWTQVEAWLDAEPVWTPVPTPRHRQALAGWLATASLRANDVPDAHLAALAVEHGLRLATTDSGFARFDGLDWFNPLRAA